MKRPLEPGAKTTDFLQVSSKGSKLGLEEASSGEQLSSLARLSKDVINRFPSWYYLTEDGGVLKWNSFVKNLYCLFWFTCAIRTSD